MNRQKIANAVSSGKKLKDMEHAELNGYNLKLQSMVESNTNQQSQINDYDGFVEFIIGEYYWVTDKDLYLLMFYGSMGDLGNFYGLNKRTFNGWLKEYLKERDSVAKEVSKLINQPESMNTKLQDINKLLKKGLNESKLPLCDTYLRQAYMPKIKRIN